MKILFLDQSNQLGGAELCLADIAQPFRSTSLVGIFGEGPFPEYLRQHKIPVKILTDHPPQVKKNSGLLTGLNSLNQLIPLITQVAQLSKDYDVIYANTPKALVVAACASLLSRCPLVYHLHDIVSPDHFSQTNRRIMITLANRAALVIANSQASREAFIQSGGQADSVQVIYNGFRLENYINCAKRQNQAWHKRDALQLNPAETTSTFVVGHFSRLSPWKGQHILIEALQYCPDHVVAVFVGDALFGEQAYGKQLHQQIKALGLEHRATFLGFRSDIPQLITACNLVAHTSIAPEPFGRVIVEAMLCGTPVIATAAGGATELIEHNQTGWLSPPSNPQKLADLIMTCHNHPEQATHMATNAQTAAYERFNVTTINRQIDQLLHTTIKI